MSSKSVLSLEVYDGSNKTENHRNGLAERLQKLLIRQASSINFIKHHMNKRAGSPSDQNQVCKFKPDFILSRP